MNPNMVKMNDILIVKIVYVFNSLKNKKKIKLVVLEQNFISKIKQY